MTPRELATKIVALNALRKQIDEALTQARAEAAAAMIPGDRVQARIGDDVIGHVRVDPGALTATVTDDTAFLAWAARHHPESVETVTVTRVRPDHVQRWLKEVRDRSGVLNEATGEIQAPDGVTLRAAAPRVVAPVAPDAPEVIGRAIADGQLPITHLTAPAIEGSQP